MDPLSSAAIDTLNGSKAKLIEKTSDKRKPFLSRCAEGTGLAFAEPSILLLYTARGPITFAWLGVGFA